MTNGRHVALGTISFAVCFAAWGLISAFAPRFRETFHLIGSADRAAGRRAGAARLAGADSDGHARPTASAAGSSSRSLMAAGRRSRSGSCRGRRATRRCWRSRSSSGWPDRRSRSVSATSRAGRRRSSRARARRLRPRQHRAVGGGLPGAGARGASSGWQRVFRGVAVAAGRLGASSSRCWRATRRRASAPQGLGAMLGVLARERLAWVSRRFYFLTFGGFVAFSDLPADAAARPVRPDAGGCRLPHRGLRGAGDAAAAGGRLALRPDRRRARAVGGVPRRRAVRAAAGLAVDAAVHGRRARLRGAARARATAPCSSSCRSTFPRETGTVTGLVGAMGGLGGFFPPLLLGVFPRPPRRDLAGVRAAGGCVAWRSGGLNARVFLPRAEAAGARPAARSSRRTADRAARRRLGDVRGRRCWSPRSWSARATCRTSIRRW